MKYFVCSIFIEGDLLYCCKSKNDNNLWSFPIGNKPHNIVYESMIESLKDEIASEFDMEFGIYRDSIEGDICINAELCYSKSSCIELCDKRESKWISLSEIDKMNWEEWAKPIVQALKEQLTKHKFIITLDKEEAAFDGWNTNYFETYSVLEKVWEKECSSIEAQRTFEEFIRKQQVSYRERKIKKWRVVRLYGESGKQIAQES